MNDPVRSKIDSSPRMSGVTRRSLVKGAAWSVPAISLAAALPAAAASPTDIGAFSLAGSCGLGGLGLVGNGFTLRASQVGDIPVGTTIGIAASGLLNLTISEIESGGVGGITVSGLNSSRVTIRLNEAIPKGTTAQFRVGLSVGVGWRLDGEVTLPAGHIGTGADSSGSVRVVAIVGCTAS